MTTYRAVGRMGRTFDDEMSEGTGYAQCGH